MSATSSATASSSRPAAREGEGAWPLRGHRRPRRRSLLRRLRAVLERLVDARLEVLVGHVVHLLDELLHVFVLLGHLAPPAGLVAGTGVRSVGLVVAHVACLLGPDDDRSATPRV